ncbi:MAG: dTDP-4-dehydrorhamnose reductase [Neisseriaceae bacterium]|nr:dTDP-4-dehydrorhamnose reductase [Neisseriaceae bacterium]
MKYLIFGANGQLGQVLCRQLQNIADVCGLHSAQFNIVDSAKVFQAAQTFMPDVIINAAAYTAVDKAECERDLCFQVNISGAENIAKAAQQVGAKIIHFSSDYVFDGKQREPYTETSPTAPLNVYGQSKLLSEQAVAQACSRHFIVRTSWLFSATGHNFVKSILRHAQQTSTLRVVTDQIGSPTWVNDLANIVMALANSNENAVDYGIYHFSGSPATSWYDFAQTIINEATSLKWLPEKPKILPILSADYPSTAARPAYSVLANHKIQAALKHTPCDWRKGLREMLRENIK